ncbi:unnamed protein product [Hermetia illucens]|uniref:Follistatin-like domain-containing protein n=1 Tax=Hermetia illucens TaxID=343691 RepID=A0A7R8V097_HERIL|nr:SPARC [Hermetia illucens]XP_037920907.1 SPARC [Hermetia illucens]CAD7090431.1 unnamed protein product [Hermetia illucens]
MKWSLLQIFGLLALVCLAYGDDPDVDIPDDLNFDDLEELEDDEALLREVEEKHMEVDIDRENEIARDVAMAFNKINPRVEVDPCTKVHCGAGRVCQADGNKASCVCIPDCPVEADPRRRVCTNINETWSSDCEVYRQRCLCDTKDPTCKNQKLKHIHIDYYGECKQLPECTEDEMNDFPRRMRDWLFNVMRDLAERSELSDYYMQMELEAETNMTKRWANAAVWKWCDLDGNPPDRSVSRHELFPIRAPLVSLEHCIAPFLESCDKDDNHRITLKEWGNCLELDEDEMLERCDDIIKPSTTTPHP